MISAGVTGPLSHHTHAKQAHSSLDLENGRRLGMDSPKFLVPSLPVSSRPLNNESAVKRRTERSIVNGTAHFNNEGSFLNNNYPILQHPNSNGVRRSYNQQNGNHNRTPQTSLHPSPPKKESGLNLMYYQQNQHVNNNTNGEFRPRSHHQMPSNPSNYHHLSRSSMPVPCSSPAAASSASPKAMSPATNSIPHNSNNSYSPQLPIVSSHSQSELNLGSPLRFYPGGPPHPTHPANVSFYAAAAAAAAASHHHGLQYPIFGAPYNHSALATSYLDNFHSTLLAHQQQQQEQHLKAAALSPSPPSRSSFHARSPLSSPGSSVSYQKAGESGRINSNYSHPLHSLQNSLGNYDPEFRHRIIPQRENENLNGNFVPMLCSGLSKGGPLGIGHMESNNLHHSTPSLSGSHFRHKESLSIAPMNEEKNTNSISSKFWNIDSSLTTPVAGKMKTLSPAEHELRIEKGIRNHFPEETDGARNKQAINGKEGSLKHRILIRSPDQTINSPIRNKMSKPVFTFPTTTEHVDTNNAERQVKEQKRIAKNNDVLFQNGNNNMSPKNVEAVPGSSLSFLFPTSPRKRTAGHFNYPSLSNTNLLPSPLTLTHHPQSIANTTTTDSAKYLSQIQKPSNKSQSSQSLPTSPYLSPNKSAQNQLSPRTPTFFNNSPTRISNATKSKGNIENHENNSRKISPLPVEQMPLIHAFRKGSLIQLASGQLRPVEELRAEDFHCAAATMADSLRILHCSIVAIQTNSTDDQHRASCKITVSVGPQKHQVVMDTTPAQPFFVLGRGWSSWSPEETGKILQLPCTPLNVGDVCITLTKISRAKLGRAGGKGPAVPKSPTMKYNKNSTTSILSAVPNRGRPSTGYASKILKVSNGSIAKTTNTTPQVSPKSPNKVHFEKTVPETVNDNTNSTTIITLPSPSPSKPTGDESTTIPPSSGVCQTDQRLEGVVENLVSNDKASPPKKRRWSAPDVNPVNEKSEENKIPIPKRPISHSPIPNKISALE